MPQSLISPSPRPYQVFSVWIFDRLVSFRNPRWLIGFSRIILPKSQSFPVSSHPISSLSSSICVASHLSNFLAQLYTHRPSVHLPFFLVSLYLHILHISSKHLSVFLSPNALVNPWGWHWQLRLITFRGPILVGSLHDRPDRHHRPFSQCVDSTAAIITSSSPCFLDSIRISTIIAILASVLTALPSMRFHHDIIIIILKITIMLMQKRQGWNKNSNRGKSEFFFATIKPKVHECSLSSGPLCP